jgi:hypothetical protein
MVWGNGQNQPNTRIWGWRAEPPYNGEVPYYCDGTTYAWGGSDAAHLLHERWCQRWTLVEGPHRREPRICVRGDIASYDEWYADVAVDT